MNIKKQQQRSLGGENILKKNKILRISIVILSILIILYGLTYIPRQIIKIEKDDVSKITIFKGDDGTKIEVTDINDIAHITNNLNSITFQKESFGYKKGFTYGIKFYHQKGELVKELTIRGDSHIQNGAFSYKATKNSVDYDYIAGLFEKQ